MIAAGIESLLIFLVFIVLSGLSTWLQKKRQSEEDAVDWPPPGDPGRAPQPPAVPPAGAPRRPRPAPFQEWEAELRRLLQGETREAPPATSPPLPPPMPARAGPRPQPPSPGHRRAPPSPDAQRQAERAAAEATSRRLEESERAYREARKRQAQAAAQLRRAQAATAERQRHSARAGHPSDRRDIRAARALLSRPGSARQAIIASVVLGTPKAFD